MSLRFMKRNCAIPFEWILHKNKVTPSLPPDKELLLKMFPAKLNIKKTQFKKHIKKGNFFFKVVQKKE